MALLRGHNGPIPLVLLLVEVGQSSENENVELDRRKVTNVLEEVLSTFRATHNHAVTYNYKIRIYENIKNT